jgi:hypothetical protein
MDGSRNILLSRAGLSQDQDRIVASCATLNELT